MNALHPVIHDSLRHGINTVAQMQKAIMSEAEHGQLLKDKARLDWIESHGQGFQWVARNSENGRGFRLHNTNASDWWPNVRSTARDAIDAAMEAQP